MGVVMVVEGGSRFFCDCGVPGHVIDLTPEEYAAGKFVLRVTLWHEPTTWKDRIKGAWDVLRGKPYLFSEIYLRDEQLQGFIAYVSQLRPQQNVTVAVTDGSTYCFSGGKWSVIK
jgi:hypothetical protein